ncbi:MAG: hypothetical protein EWV76_24135 [Microcystis novacekii Mn_MB_F_20050700_S1]|uniref:Uncharacterized protein n=1 Tax=Microcystis novacekii Mn_MB_F_20050700_S1D TaxID=2486266 RepID=A0A552J233_9CHRO|nr:MAG: hypothetical protein EWV76_24135 [Microcystis novacekii Mn_MB_F_20050700_S1]TRU89806.1 MAG: hypothetical protein EWV54_07920 [Microcystis novacekii Mn_MB_F_20050700_S1D]
MIGGALRRIVSFKSKQEFWPSNAPYLLLYFILNCNRLLTDSCLLPIADVRAISQLIEIISRQKRQ